MEYRFIEDFINIITDCYNLGWHERNGGNISYRLCDQEVEQISNKLCTVKTIALQTAIPQLKNEYFLVSGTGRYFRNVKKYPKENIGIIKLSEDGSHYDIVWGLEKSLPTSELMTHLLNHALIKNDGYRTILHGHQTNLIALSFIFNGSDKDLTNELWKMMTECMVVFPNGIKVIDWMVPGTVGIGIETSKYIKDYDVVIWKHHGAFVKGRDLDEAFGLIETVEKASEIYLKILSTQMPMVSTISNENLDNLAKAFNIRRK